MGALITTDFHHHSSGRAPPVQTEMHTFAPQGGFPGWAMNCHVICFVSSSWAPWFSLPRHGSGVQEREQGEPGITNPETRVSRKDPLSHWLKWGSPLFPTRGPQPPDVVYTEQNSGLRMAYVLCKESLSARSISSHLISNMKQRSGGMCMF